MHVLCGDILANYLDLSADLHLLRAPILLAGAPLLEVGRGERALAAEAVEEGHRLGPALAGEGAHGGVARRAPVGARHAPAEQRVEVEGEQRRFVRPIFEQRARPAPGGAIEHRPRISTEPREERQVMRPGEHVDAVDLQQLRVPEHPAQVTHVHRPARSVRAETLRR